MRYRKCCLSSSRKASLYDATSSLNKMEWPHLNIAGKHAEQTLCPHSSNCTGYRSTSLHTGHWYFSANGKTNVTFIFSLGCSWLREPGLEWPLVGRELVELLFFPAVKSYQYPKLICLLVILTLFQNLS